MNFLMKLLSSYDYKTLKELFESMFPSWKYHLQNLSLLVSGISGLLSYLFGFGPVLGIAMFLAVLTEIITGLKASSKQGQNFQSFRFSRCVFKLALWAVLFFVIHQFENEYAGRTHVFDMIAFLFFKLVFLGAMSMFLVEHITSILENKAIIDEKPKTYFIEFIQDTWKGMLNTLKDRIK